MPVNLSLTYQPESARTSHAGDNLSETPASICVSQELPGTESILGIDPNATERRGHLLVSYQSAFTITPSRSAVMLPDSTVATSESRVMSSLEDGALIKDVFLDLMSSIPGFQTLCSTEFEEGFGRVDTVSSLTVRAPSSSPRSHPHRTWS